GAAGDAALTQQSYAAGAGELRRLGFTVDFAPDADVTSGPGDPTIGSRSASSRSETVAEHVVAAADGFSSAGVLPVVKHFPGHGSVPADSHLTLPVQTKSVQELGASDLVPFRAAVEGGLPAVMIGHIDVRAVDPRVPSSLSRKVTTGLLRDELGFDGLVVTDSLEMAAVTRGRDPGRTAVQAMRAGADVLLMPPSPAVA
ncbi:glycoside hydrolase family 3 protein, partial [Cellulomonas telluris]|uniref:glycoside hydrolase family 3 protein n=1 Tax=Cellulomonas telluris TaxID=2306636 RepID=UPI0016574A91